MKILVINGPNINMLGIRERDIYGEKSYKELKNYIKKSAKELGVKVKIFQSNYEGKIIEKIQKAYRKFDGLLINPAGYTHTSVSIADAIKAVGIFAVEVHLSNVKEREDFRKISYFEGVCKKTVYGKGFSGYSEGLRFIKDGQGK